MAQSGLSGLGVGTLQLEVVVVESDNVGVGESSDFSGGTANTASDVEDPLVGLQSHLQGEVVLVSRELQREWVCETTRMGGYGARGTRERMNQHTPWRKGSPG